MIREIPRPMARAPIVLFQAGLGVLTLGRLAMIEHRGRRTGRAHLVVLEVVGFDTDSVAVVSGYGSSADWYRNLRADPQVRLWWRRRRAAAATAEIVDADGTWQVLETYRHRYPRAAQAFGRMLAIPDLAAGTPLASTVADRLPVVRIRWAPPPG